MNTSDELFLEYLEECNGNVTEASEKAGISRSSGFRKARKLSEEIVKRSREKLASASLKAASTAIELMDADSSTEQAQVRLAAAEKVMDRVGLTRHTSVEVQVESQHGLFILPGKDPVAPEEPSEDETDPQ